MNNIINCFFVELYVCDGYNASLATSCREVEKAMQISYIQ